jgi:hypothetical protein
MISQAGGNEENGFALTADEQSGTVRVRAWGFWSDDLARLFANAVVEAFKPDQRLEIDASALKPQRDTCQQELASMFGRLARLGIKRVVVSVDNAITKLQLARIGKENAPHATIEFKTSPKRVA